MAGEAVAETASEMAAEMAREAMQAGGPRRELAAPITPSQPVAVAHGGNALLSQDHPDAVDIVTGEPNPRTVFPASIQVKPRTKKTPLESGVLF